MKLMDINEYQQTRYTEASRPSKRKLIRLIQDGEIPGKRLGRTYYVDIEAEEKTTGNVLVDRVILNG